MLKCLKKCNNAALRYCRKRKDEHQNKEKKERKENYERYKLEKEFLKISIEVDGLVSSLDCYFIRALIKKNVNCIVKTTVRRHEKKFKELARNIVLPFTPAETVLNLSGTRLSDDELEILKYGWNIPLSLYV